MLSAMDVISNGKTSLSTQSALHCHLFVIHGVTVKSRAVPYSITCVGHRADPGLLAVRPAGDISHKRGGRLPLLSTRPVVTFPAKDIIPLPRSVPNYTAW